MRFLFPGFVRVAVVVLLTAINAAHASQVIQLDPNAPDLPPPTAKSVIVVGATSQRKCAARLMPNGVAVIAPACDLGERVRRVRSWKKDGKVISFHDDHGRRLFRFQPASSGPLRSIERDPERLDLVFLPEMSRPM
jgi:hypothetical protein